MNKTDNRTPQKQPFAQVNRSLQSSNRAMSENKYRRLLNANEFGQKNYNTIKEDDTEGTAPPTFSFNPEVQLHNLYKYKPLETFNVIDKGTKP